MSALLRNGYYAVLYAILMACASAFIADESKYLLTLSGLLWSRLLSPFNKETSIFQGVLITLLTKSLFPALPLPFTMICVGKMTMFMNVGIAVHSLWYRAILIGVDVFDIYVALYHQHAVTHYALTVFYDIGAMVMGADIREMLDTNRGLQESNTVLARFSSLPTAPRESRAIRLDKHMDRMTHHKRKYQHLLVDDDSSSSSMSSCGEMSLKTQMARIEQQNLDMRNLLDKLMHMQQDTQMGVLERNEAFTKLLGVHNSLASGVQILTSTEVE